MRTVMFRDGLQTGMLVRFRKDTGYHLVLRNVLIGDLLQQDMFVNAGGWMPFVKYNKDMTFNGDSDYDIVEVWRPLQSSALRIPCGEEGMSAVDYYKQIYARIDDEDSAVEMTIEEIEEVVGRKIKVVSDESRKSVVSCKVPSSEL